MTGGASGNPLVDSQGRVIGLVSGMNIIGISSGRAPNAVNFAQRADLLEELIDAPSEAAEGDRRKAWQVGFDTFDNPSETVPLQLVKMWQNEIGATEQPIALPPRSAKLVKDEASGGYYHVFDDVFSEKGRYLIVAVSGGRKDIDLAIVRRANGSGEYCL